MWQVDPDEASPAGGESLAQSTDQPGARASQVAQAPENEREAREVAGAMTPRVRRAKALAGLSALLGLCLGALVPGPAPQPAPQPSWPEPVAAPPATDPAQEVQSLQAALGFLKQAEDLRERYPQEPGALYQSVRAYEQAQAALGQVTLPSAVMSLTDRGLAEGSESLAEGIQAAHLAFLSAQETGQRAAAEQALLELTELIPDPTHDEHQWAQEQRRRLASGLP